MAATAPAAAAAQQETLWRWLTFSPALALLLAFSVLPILNLLVVSFLNVQWSAGRASVTPAGLAHYGALCFLLPPLLLVRRPRTALDDD